MAEQDLRDYREAQARRDENAAGQRGQLADARNHRGEPPTRPNR